MRYLVTGGAGFIGSHVVDRLVAEGHQVRVVDNLFSGRLDNLDQSRAKMEFLEGDIRDRRLMAAVCQGVDAVIHEAALRSVPESMNDPYGYTEVNVLGTVNLLDAAARAKVRRVVCVSSSSVYGDTTATRLHEALPLRPISPYAVSKLAGEEVCGMFSRAFGLEAVAVRYFNVFGPRQSLANQYAVVVPKFITCLLRGESPPIYGDGTQTRDFTYVDNVVEATLLAARVPGISGEVFNVALGEEHSVLELLEALHRILNVSTPPTFLPKRAGDIYRTCADPSKARRLLSWNGRVDFVEGLRRTAAWFGERQRAATPASSSR